MPEAVGGGSVQRVERAGQPQFQLETGPACAGAAVHCWVASWASMDSMALTMVFMRGFLSGQCFWGLQSWAFRAEPPFLRAQL